MSPHPLPSVDPVPLPLIHVVHRHVLPAAYSLLPPWMRDVRADALLLAIGLQESKFLHRRQLPNGPAQGFWQFEAGGSVKGVLLHPKTAVHARTVLSVLRYDPNSSATQVHAKIMDNDVLAAVFARLLLWTVPGALPTREQSAASWRQYVEGWRPGAPHPETWNAYYAAAWAVVERQGTV